MYIYLSIYIFIYIYIHTYVYVYIRIHIHDKGADCSLSAALTAQRDIYIYINTMYIPYLINLCKSYAIMIKVLIVL
jgi:hypothetical protein